MVSSMQRLGGPHESLELGMVRVRVRVSYLNRSFVDVSVNSFCGTIYRVAL